MIRIDLIKNTISNYIKELEEIGNELTCPEDNDFCCFVRNTVLKYSNFLKQCINELDFSKIEERKKIFSKYFSNDQVVNLHLLLVLMYSMRQDWHCLDKERRDLILTILENDNILDEDLRHSLYITALGYAYNQEFKDGRIFRDGFRLLGVHGNLAFNILGDDRTKSFGYCGNYYELITYLVMKGLYSDEKLVQALELYRRFLMDNLSILYECEKEDWKIFIETCEQFTEDEIRDFLSYENILRQVNNYIINMIYDIENWVMDLTNCIMNMLKISKEDLTYYLKKICELGIEKAHKDSKVVEILKKHNLEKYNISYIIFQLGDKLRKTLIS